MADIGRPCSTNYEELNFTLVKGGHKYLALCNVCKKYLHNIAKKRLISHRRICESNKKKRFTVTDKPKANINVHHEDQSSAECQPKRSASLYVGRPCSTNYEELDFILVKEGPKYLALCNVCKTYLHNIAKKRLILHRRSCKSNKLKRFTVIDKPSANINVHQEDQSSAECQPKRSASLYVGRPCSTNYEELNFMLVKEGPKYLALCNVCKTYLHNIAKKRLILHRRICNNKLKFITVTDRPNANINVHLKDQSSAECQLVDFEVSLDFTSTSPNIGIQNAQQKAELYFLKRENEELKRKLDDLTTFSFEHIKTDKRMQMYTGLPTMYLFETLLSLFDNIPFTYYREGTVGKISMKDQLLITLMKLRLNLLYRDLACRWNCNETTIRNIVLTWVYALHEILFKQLMVDNPSQRKNKACMSTCFSAFTNSRIVIDCIEVKCARPTSLEKQRFTYSYYKHLNSVKALIGVAPNGVVTFASDLYPCWTSDKQIAKDCGILNKMVPGNLIIADNGFLIKDLLPKGVNYNIPPFLMTQRFSREEVIETCTIAKARIHLERAIRRINCYMILSAIPSSLLPQATIIFQVCAALTNLKLIVNI